MSKPLTVTLLGGNQTSQTDALSRQTSFALDGLGRRTQRTLPLTASESFGYDKASRLLAQTNFNGTIISSQYDQLGRLWKRWNGSTLLETYTYSARIELALAAGPPWEEVTAS